MEFNDIKMQITTFIEGNGDLVSLGLLFACITMIALVLANSYKKNYGVKSRFGVFKKPELSKEGNLSVRINEHDSFWNHVIIMLQERGFPRSEKDITELKLKMLRAGYTHPLAANFYFMVRIFLAIGLPVLVLIFSPLLSREITVLNITNISILAGGIGLYGPYLWINKAIRHRQRKITESFPDALDLLVVCVEAGLGLDAAFTRVGTQISRAHPLLSSELAIVALELRAGKSRQDALRNLSTRTGLPAIQSLVTLLIQSEKLGSSIAVSLRVYASEMRLKRMQKAEEKAHMLPVLLSVPLVACILPTMISVIMLPGFINILRHIQPVLQGTPGS